jgi:hypothetical protein
VLRHERHSRVESGIVGGLAANRHSALQQFHGSIFYHSRCVSVRAPNYCAAGGVCGARIYSGQPQRQRRSQAHVTVVPGYPNRIPRSGFIHPLARWQFSAPTLVVPVPAEYPFPRVQSTRKLRYPGGELLLVANRPEFYPGESLPTFHKMDVRINEAGAKHSAPRVDNSCVPGKRLLYGGT